MNLFCFSLEGSMESLYEPVRNNHDTQVYTIPSRPSSAGVSVDEDTLWCGPERSLSLEFTQLHHASSKKKKKKAQIPKSASDMEAIDEADRHYHYWVMAQKSEDLPHSQTSKNKDSRQPDPKAGGHRNGQLSRAGRKEGQEVQAMSFEAWNPNQERPNSRQQDLVKDADGAVGGLRRMQKSVRTKGNQSETDPKGSLHTSDLPVVSCGGLIKKPEKKPCRSEAPEPTQENTAPATRASSCRQRWRNPSECPPSWGASYHTCRRPLTEYRVYAHDFTLPRGKDWEKHEGQQERKQDPSPQRVVRSVTDLDLHHARVSNLGA